MKDIPGREVFAARTAVLVDMLKNHKFTKQNVPIYLLKARDVGPTPIKRTLTFVFKIKAVPALRNNCEFYSLCMQNSLFSVRKTVYDSLSFRLKTGIFWWKRQLFLNIATQASKNLDSSWFKSLEIATTLISHSKNLLQFPSASFRRSTKNQP